MLNSMNKWKCLESIIIGAAAAGMAIYSKTCLQGIPVHDRCPLVAGSLTWANTVVRKKRRLITGCPLIGVYLEDIFYCTPTEEGTTIEIQGFKPGVIHQCIYINIHDCILF